MSIAIRAGDLVSDRETIIDILFRFLTPLSDNRRFDWLYRGNPLGETRVWIAFDTQSSTVVGVAGAFPRRLYVNGREVVIWVLGDFCIHEQYRSLGPALQLQRACLAGVDSGEATLCYDFPSATMMAVYARLGIQPWDEMLRLARPLRVDRKVRDLVTTPVVGHGLSALGNLWLTFTDRRTKDPDYLTISIHKGDCGDEFSALARKVGGQYGVCTARSAEYLNWRYLENPLYRYEILTARREDILLAYAVFTHSEQDATLADLFGMEEAEVLGCLIGRLAALLRSRGVVTLSAYMVKSHRWISIFQDFGFRVREASPMVVYPHPSWGSGSNSLADVEWFIMLGDRDS